MAEENSVPLLGSIIPMYKGRYPAKTIEIAYGALRERITSLEPIVKANGSHPLLDEDDWEKGQKGPEMDKRNAVNSSTKQTLDDCKAAWERLISGEFGICSNCDNIISADRIQALPYANKCSDCQRKKGVHGIY